MYGDREVRTIPSRHRKSSAVASRAQRLPLPTEAGVTPGKKISACCRIGEPSSHSLFDPKDLLGYLNDRYCDGSWTEWGNLVRTPIEK